MNFPRFIALRLSGSGNRSFTRTIIRIAIAAVAISMCVMIVTLAMIRGFKTEISQKVYGFWGHINITDIRADDSYEAMPIDVNPALLASLRDIGQVEVNYGQGKYVASRGGVKHVQAVAHIPAMFTSQGEREGLVIKGAGQDFDWSTMQKFLTGGKLPSVEDTVAAEMLISEYTSRRLQIGVGQHIVVHVLKNNRQVRRRFTVCGIFRTGLEDYDKKFALTSIGIVQELLGWADTQVGGYEIFVENVDDAELINDYIYLEELPNELFAQTIRSRFPGIFEWLQLQDVNLVVILGLMMVVSIINMVSVLLILILERTRMIGVLKAIGSSNRQIRSIFLHHAIFIVLRGLLIGNALGLLICWLQMRFRIIKLNEADYYVSYAPVQLDVAPIVLINVIAVVLIMLFLIIPSYLVTRIDPVKTIQFR